MATSKVKTTATSTPLHGQKTMKYIYYKTDGSKTDIFSKKPLSLEKLQSLVGGYIESLPLKNGNCLFVNEEGVIHDLPINPHFTQKDTTVDISTYGLRGDVIEGKVNIETGDFVGI